MGLAPMEMAVGAVRRLMACQMEQGAVIYEVDLVTGSESNRHYNMVRMAGVAYSLGWAARRFAETAGLGEELGHVSERANAFLLRSCELQQDGFYVGEYTFDGGLSEVGKLGATALLLMALLLSPRSEAYEEPIGRLVETMLRAQTEKGAFWAFVGERRLSGQRYASGEVLLALVRYFERTGEREVLRAVERAFPYYRTYHAFDPHQGMVLWHADTWSRMARFPEIGAGAKTEYATFADALVADLPRRQVQAGTNMEPKHEGGIMFDSRPGVSTSLYAEAMGRVATMHRTHENAASAERYVLAIGRAMEFLPRLQVREAEVNAARVVGGFRGNLPSTTLRMDNDQHVITCCLALEEDGLLARPEEALMLEEMEDAVNV